MRRSRFAIGAAIGAASVAIAGTYASYKYGVRVGIQKQAKVAEILTLDRLNAAKREADLQISTATSQVRQLQKELDDRAAAIAAAKIEAVNTPYTSSDMELSDETKRVLSEPGLVLPQRFYLVEGKQTGIYWKGIVPARDPETFVYSVSCTCDFATLERRQVELAPAKSSAGQYRLTVVLSDTKGNEIVRRQIELVVVPDNAGENKHVEMLLVGDSLGHQSRFPNRLAALFEQPGNPEVIFRGSHRPAGSNIPHEQYGGWTFQSFLSNISMDPKIYHTDRSPLVFDLSNGKPKVDVQRYLDETLKGARPDFVHIQLGINDAFGIDPDGSDSDTRLNAIIANADLLISELRKALPDANITVGSVIQANATDRAFIESYRGRPQFYSEWRWRRVQMQLAMRMVAHFENRTTEKVFLVPTHMTVDALDGYNAHVWKPEGVDYDLSNAVHPSHTGDKQLAGAIYGVVKARLAGVLSPD